MSQGDSLQRESRGLHNEGTGLEIFGGLKMLGVTTTNFYSTVLLSQDVEVKVSY